MTFLRSMSRTKLLLLFTFLVAVSVVICLIWWYQTQGYYGSVDKVKMEIYYETLCPDSYGFIRNELAHVYNKLRDEYLDVDFIPYGKATEEVTEGKWEISCQHGQRECYFNMVAACALHHGEVKSVKQKVGFAVCMSRASPHLKESDIMNCCAKNDIQWSEVKSCKSNAKINVELQKQMGVKTRKYVRHFRSMLDNVPTIVLNGIAKNGERMDLTHEVCEILKGKNLPLCQRIF